MCMRIAVSIPDEVFDDAERLARRQKVSRSELYSQAIQEYIARHMPDRITEALDRVLEDLPTESDPFVTEAGRRLLGWRDE